MAEVAARVTHEALDARIGGVRDREDRGERARAPVDHAEPVHEAPAQGEVRQAVAIHVGEGVDVAVELLDGVGAEALHPRRAPHELRALRPAFGDHGRGVAGVVDGAHRGVPGDRRGRGDEGAGGVGRGVPRVRAGKGEGHGCAGGRGQEGRVAPGQGRGQARRLEVRLAADGRAAVAHIPGAGRRADEPVVGRGREVQLQGRQTPVEHGQGDLGRRGSHEVHVGREARLRAVARGVLDDHAHGLPVAVGQAQVAQRAHPGHGQVGGQARAAKARRRTVALHGHQARGAAVVAGAEAQGDLEIRRQAPVVGEAEGVHAAAGWRGSAAQGLGEQGDDGIVEVHREVYCAALGHRAALPLGTGLQGEALTVREGEMHGGLTRDHGDRGKPGLGVAEELDGVAAGAGARQEQGHVEVHAIAVRAGSRAEGVVHEPRRREPAPGQGAGGDGDREGQLRPGDVPHRVANLEEGQVVRRGAERHRDDDGGLGATGVGHRAAGEELRRSALLEGGVAEALKAQAPCGRVAGGGGGDRHLVASLARAGVVGIAEERAGLRAQNAGAGRRGVHLDPGGGGVGHSGVAGLVAELRPEAVAAVGEAAVARLREAGDPVGRDGALGDEDRVIPEAQDRAGLVARDDQIEGAVGGEQGRAGRGTELEDGWHRVHQEEEADLRRAGVSGAVPDLGAEHARTLAERHRRLEGSAGERTTGRREAVHGDARPALGFAGGYEEAEAAAGLLGQVQGSGRGLGVARGLEPARDGAHGVAPDPPLALGRVAGLEAAHPGITRAHLGLHHERVEAVGERGRRDRGRHTIHGGKAHHLEARAGARRAGEARAGGAGAQGRGAARDPLEGDDELGVALGVPGLDTAPLHAQPGATGGVGDARDLGQGRGHHEAQKGRRREHLDRITQGRGAVSGAIAELGAEDQGAIGEGAHARAHGGRGAVADVEGDRYLEPVELGLGDLVQDRHEDALAGLHAGEAQGHGGLHAGGARIQVVGRQEGAARGRGEGLDHGRRLVHAEAVLGGRRGVPGAVGGHHAQGDGALGESPHAEAHDARDALRGGRIHRDGEAIHEGGASEDLHGELATGFQALGARHEPHLHAESLGIEVGGGPEEGAGGLHELHARRHAVHADPDPRCDGQGAGGIGGLGDEGAGAAVGQDHTLEADGLVLDHALVVLCAGRATVDAQIHRATGLDLRGGEDDVEGAVAPERCAQRALEVQLGLVQRRGKGQAGQGGLSGELQDGALAGAPGDGDVDGEEVLTRVERDRREEEPASAQLRGGEPKGLAIAGQVRL